MNCYSKRASCLLSRILLAGLLLSLMPLELGAQMITAHRGFWDCEKGGGAQNSIASLRTAQEEGLWGSELDVQLTFDGRTLVNHDNSRDGLKIIENPLSSFKKMSLPNGENPSTFDEYLTQGEKSKCILVVELKPQKDTASEDFLVEESLRELRAHCLMNNYSVIFISFSLHICEVLAKDNPGFMVQYLNGDLSPEELREKGIMGLDYHYSVFDANPDYVKRAHDLGMSVNVWTVDNEDDMRRMIELGVDCITTNKPLLARALLGEKEIRIPTI